MCSWEIFAGLAILITAGNGSLFIDGESLDDGSIAGEPGLAKVS